MRTLFALLTAATLAPVKFAVVMPAAQERTTTGRETTVGQARSMEQPHLLPLPEEGLLSPYPETVDRRDSA